MCHKVKIEPATENTWDKLLKKSIYATPFHDYQWGVLTTELLGGEYVPLVATKDDYQWLIPGYRLKPWAKSQGHFRIGSIGYGGPLPVHKMISSDSEIRNVNGILNQIASQLKLSKINALLYPAHEWSALTNTNLQFGSTCKVALSSNSKELFDDTLSGNVRTAIRKSVKEGVVVRSVNVNNDSEMTQAHDLLCSTQNRVAASYTTSYKIFEALASKKMTNTSSQTFIAVHNGVLVGTSTLLYDDAQAFHLFHGWDRSFTKLCANQALIWHMMCFAIELGIKTFNMGESHTDALLEAKMRWGGHIELIPKFELLN